ncbi:hypothetical protein ARMGADRAFT_1088662 [Armillaria gallica]|uniref:Uncharacterized protein n=1 Tax=Armillaria gallica TaxID=47427 RepID=A0A2H3D9Q5_ARMGA|nr:hypothetical protein ARMGADRAFT_1088662 [Armillaria gallica]
MTLVSLPFLWEYPVPLSSPLLSFLQSVPTTPTNNDDAILLEQLPPRIFTPIPWRPIPINEFARAGVNKEEENAPESISPIIPERRTPTPPRRRTPIITITSSLPPSPQYVTYVPQTLSPSMYARFTTSTNYNTWADRYPTPPPTAGIASEEFWDNVDIPYSAYFPSDRGLPDHRTPPPSGHRNVRMWDQPIQNWELTPEPVRAIEEPVAGPSMSAHLYPTRRSASAWERLEQRLHEQLTPEPQPELSKATIMVQPPRPLTPFPDFTPDHIPQTTDEPPGSVCSEIAVTTYNLLTISFMWPFTKPNIASLAQVES